MSLYNSSEPGQGLESRPLDPEAGAHQSLETLRKTRRQRERQQERRQAKSLMRKNNICARAL